ncbi:MAG: hypothetical protein H0X49_07565 [Acidobacteria bacterium]|nr:hypothetical protein [Acidobacteriota bacterium]
MGDDKNTPLISKYIDRYALLCRLIWIKSSLGLKENFIEKQVTLIGENEFEDAFDDNVLIAALENKYIEVDKKHWQLLDLAALRQKEKFSEALLSEVGKIAFEFGFKDSKPKFAAALAQQCSKEQIPPKVFEAFKALRSRIGISNSIID